MGKRIGMWIISMLGTYGGNIVARVMVALGLGYVTYNFSVQPLRQLMIDQLSSMPAQAIQIVGFLGIDKAITIVLSAVVAKYAVSGVKRLVKA